MASNVGIVVPVYNEERALPRNILILTDFLKANVANPWQVIIADNASTDGTCSVSEMLCERCSGVGNRHIPQKGRGRALEPPGWTAPPISSVTWTLTSPPTWFTFPS